MSARANAVWMSRHLWQLSYESTQTPGYYLVMAPLWWIADHIGGTLAAVYVMRVVNVLLVALLAPMAWFVAMRIAPARVDIAWASVVLAALLPGLAFDGTRVSNDSLGAVVGGLVILLCIRWAGELWTWRRALILGALVGIALVVKLTLFGLFVPAGVAMLWPVRGRSLVERGVMALNALVMAVGLLMPWLAVNIALYGSVFRGSRIERLTPTLPQPFSLHFIPFDALFFTISYWGGEPLGALPLAAGVIALGSLLTLIAAFGIVRVTLKRGLTPAGAVGLIAIAAVVGSALALPASSGFQFAAPGRYAYPALVALAPMTALGIAAVLRAPFGLSGMVAMYAVVALAALGSELVPEAPLDPGPQAPSANAVIESINGVGKIGGVIVTVDKVAVDDAAHSLWLDVIVRNDSQSTAEWSATATVVVDGTQLPSDYVTSTHLPGEISVGQTLTGWLRVPLGAVELTNGQSVLVRFPDVAADNYRTVDDVDIRVAL